LVFQLVAFPFWGNEEQGLFNFHAISSPTNLMQSRQSAYRHRHSTETALLHVQFVHIHNDIVPAL
jgi:hypothetical protein